MHEYGHILVTFGRSTNRRLFHADEIQKYHPRFNYAYTSSIHKMMLYSANILAAHLHCYGV